MKSISKVLGALVIGFVGVANAEQVTVDEVPLESSTEQISANFAANPELGRAWVEVNVPSGFSGSEPDFAGPIPKKVKGLYYDSARKQVLYRTATGPIVCAEDVSTHGDPDLKSTGNCRLTESTEKLNVDDGFDVREETVAKIVLDAQTPADRLQAAAPRE